MCEWYAARIDSSFRPLCSPNAGKKKHRKQYWNEKSRNQWSIIRSRLSLSLTTCDIREHRSSNENINYCSLKRWTKEFYSKGTCLWTFRENSAMYEFLVSHFLRALQSTAVRKEFFEMELSYTTFPFPVFSAELDAEINERGNLAEEKLISYWLQYPLRPTCIRSPDKETDPRYHRRRDKLREEPFITGSTALSFNLPADYKKLGAIRMADANALEYSCRTACRQLRVSRKEDFPPKLSATLASTSSDSSPRNKSLSRCTRTSRLRRLRATIDVTGVVAGRRNTPCRFRERGRRALYDSPERSATTI